jgi:hypothetical protein
LGGDIADGGSIKIVFLYAFAAWISRQFRQICSFRWICNLAEVKVADNDIIYGFQHGFSGIHVNVLL